MDLNGYLTLPVNGTNFTDFDPSVFSIGEAWNVAQPLVLLILGITIYSIFIFKFYRFLARKDIFGLNLRQYNEHEGFFGKLFDGLLYTVEYIIVFPLFVFFWFIIISFFIGLISSRPFGHVLLVSMGLVAAARVTAYYNEELSKDVAKMIPFALLGIFIIDYKALDVQTIWQVVLNIFAMWKIGIYYLVVAIALELILRIVVGFVDLFRKDKVQDL